MSKLIITGNPNPQIENLETKDHIKDSIFKDNYLKATKVINNIIQQNKKQDKEQENETYEDCTNNLVIFEGDRGTGKTSCMLSLTKLYSQKNIEDELKKFTGIDNKDIEVEELIDPSILNKESIIEIVVAKMLKKCRSKLESNDLEDFIRRDLIEKFQIVFRDLKNIKKNMCNDKNCIYDEEIEDLEKLLLLSSSVTLRKNLKSLVDAYLKVIGNEKKILLLQIDDIDLNITYTNNIIEDIRRYLIIPNVVILISAKLNQIKSMIRQKNRKNNEYIDDDEIEEITEKYIQKIFPNTNIITMPDMLSEAQKTYSKYEGLSIENYIIKTIYDKTGYKFIKPVFGLNFIIPKTLREINIFIYFLNTLEKIHSKDNEDDQKDNKYLENLNILVNYLLKIQIKEKLKTEDYNFLLNLYNNRISNCNLSIMRYLINKLIFNDVSTKNNKLSILKSINDYLNKFMRKKDDEKDKNKNNTEEEFKKSIVSNLEFMRKIVSNNFSEANLSLGVLIRVFEICNTYFIDDYDKLMLNYTELIYSMLLYKSQIQYLQSNDKSKTDLQRYISKDIYGNFEELYDFKKQMYKLKEKIQIPPKEMNNKENEFCKIKLRNNKEYNYENIRKNLQKEDIILYKMKYLLYNLIIPIRPQDKDFYLSREIKFDEFDIPYNQKYFYYNGTLALTNIFYSKPIFDFVQCKVKDNKEIVKFKEKVQNGLDKIVTQIPFYNIDFLISLFDQQVKLSNKTRIKSRDICEFTRTFLEDINEIINEIMYRTLSIENNDGEEKNNIFKYEKNVLINNLEVYNLLKEEEKELEIYKVISQLSSLDDK